VFVEEADDVRQLLHFSDFDSCFVAFSAAYVEQVIVSVDEQGFESIQLLVDDHLQHVVIYYLTNLGAVGHLWRMRSYPQLSAFSYARSLPVM